jgi:hypothetical protein
VVRADSRFEMDVEVLSSGFRPSWFRRGTTVGTIEQRIELVGGGPSGAA